MNLESKYNPDLRDDVNELRDEREKSAALSHEYWPLHDADLESFAREFQPVIPDTEDDKSASDRFVEYIEQTLPDHKTGHLTAVELGGPGVKLFEGFPKGFFELTIGVCLEDSKNPVKKAGPSSTHSIIEADLLKNFTYKKIRKALPNGETNLIICRMYGGADEMPSNPVILAKLLDTWYKLLTDGGLMFVQYRLSVGDRWVSENEIEKNVREKLVNEWAQFIQESYGETLEVQMGTYAFRLLKKPGAPKDLPMLENFDPTPIIEKRS